MQISYNNKFDVPCCLWPMAFLTHFPNLKIPRTRERVKYPIQGNWDRSVFRFFWWDMLLLEEILHHLLSIKPYKKLGHSPYQLDFFSINSLSVSSVPSFPSSIAAQALQGLGIYRAIHWPYRLGRRPEGTHLLRENPNKPFQPTKTRDRFEKMTSFQGVGHMSILMLSSLRCFFLKENPHPFTSIPKRNGNIKKKLYKNPAGLPPSGWNSTQTISPNHPAWVQAKGAPSQRLGQHSKV